MALTDCHTLTLSIRQRDIHHQHLRQMTGMAGAAMSPADRAGMSGRPWSGQADMAMPNDVITVPRPDLLRGGDTSSRSRRAGGYTGRNHPGDVAGYRHCLLKMGDKPRLPSGIPKTR